MGMGRDNVLGLGAGEQERGEKREKGRLRLMTAWVESVSMAHFVHISPGLIDGHLSLPWLTL